MSKPVIVTNLYFNIGIFAAAGELASRGFELTQPLGGALFGATTMTVEYLTELLLDKIFDNSVLGKTTKFAISFFVGIIAACYLTTLVGYTFSIAEGIVFTLTMCAVELAIQCMIRFCPCLIPFSHQLPAKA